VTVVNPVDRAALKRLIRSFREASDGRAVALLLLDLALFAAAATLTVAVDGIALKLAAGSAMGLQIARLFVIGHDACHQCFVSDRDWNRRIGWIAFLPSLTTYSLWEAGHNLGHHVFTNLRGRDYVWTPFSKPEYDGLPIWRRVLERFYRSGFGHWAYYLIELWWKKLFFPSALEMPGRRDVHRRDSQWVSGFAVIWILALVAAALATRQSPALVVATAFLWPLVVWCGCMGSVIYFHHTHPDLPWYSDAAQWEAERDGVSTSLHLTFPGRLRWILNNIMTHPVHHLDVRIPLYRIDAAQRVLGDSVREQAFSLAYAVDCTRRCKLYDYDSQRWMDFGGRYTSPARGAPASLQSSGGEKLT